MKTVLKNLYRRELRLYQTDCLCITRWQFIYSSQQGNALDELHLDDPLNLVDSMHRVTNSPISNLISAGLASSGLLDSSAPINIPGMAKRSVLSNSSPSTSSPLQHLQSAGFLTELRFSHQDPIESTMPFLSHSVSDPFSNHISQLSSSTSKLSGFNSSQFDLQIKDYRHRVHSH
ncbi:uncharacterized protein LOC130663692 isoform X2 [Microplitis mediator]|uniref:uncharacterized protein LOC130663692 isoform X2 n=1 Tax=Microplitis mediator TaxID=375433 RepID=UPI0025561BAB|nr:uncharacterized protein LOC130663692 isoform X2 [Microplitis mediator]